MPKITIYTKDPCPYCVAAKRLLEQRGVGYREIELSWEDHQAMAELIQRSGMRTVPQIFAGEELIGGYMELAALDRKDQLRSLKS